MNARTSGLSQQKTRLEIQIHPSDIQRGVRYLFLTRRRLWLVCSLLVGWLVLTGTGLALAPNVVATLLRHREHRALLLTRDDLGDRLLSLRQQIGKLHARSEQLRLRMSKIYLAYGLTTDQSIGQGGYPLEGGTVPAAVDLDPRWGVEVRATLDEEARLREQVRVLEAFIEEIQFFETAHRDQVSSTPSMSPLQGELFPLTSPFGERRSPFTKQLDFHAGIDLGAPTGTPIYAPADATVTFSGRYPLRQSVAWWRYGNLVALRHGEGFITLFGHLDSVQVRVGQLVEQGNVLGWVGNTGWSTNPHLHYEVRRRDDSGSYTPVDPRIYMLDHRWSDEEKLLVQARNAPTAAFEALPKVIQQ